MRKIEVNEKGMVDAETGEPINMDDPMLSQMMRRQTPPTGKTNEPPKSEESTSREEIEGKKSEVSEVNKTNENAPQSPSLASYRGPKPVSYSKYEVTPQSEFTIRFCLAFEEGRPLIYVEKAKQSHPEYESHWVTFRMWTYKEQLEWRQKCTEYDNMTGASKLNTTRYNEIKLRNLIKAWSFEEYDSKFKLLHVRGILSDESYDLINGLFPNIVDNIIYMMNQILEDNQ